MRTDPRRKVDSKRAVPFKPLGQPQSSTVPTTAPTTPANPRANEPSHAGSHGAANVETKGIKAWRWFIFTVIGGLLPFLLSAVWTFAEGGRFNLSDILGRGDLYMVSCVLSAGAFGEIVGRKIGKAANQYVMLGYAMVVVFGVFIIGIMSAFLFAIVTGELTTLHRVQHPYRTTWLSFWIFLFSVLFAFLCIWLPEQE